MIDHRHTVEREMVCRAVEFFLWVHLLRQDYNRYAYLWLWEKP